MAGVDADADAVVSDGGERCDRVGGGLDRAAGFGFEADPDGLAGQLGQDVETFGEGGEGGVRRAGGLRVAGVRGAPGDREGGDGAFGDVVGKQCGQEPGKIGGVGEPFGVRPVRLVHPVLDLFGAEAFIGETVQGDDFEAAAVEFGAQ